jgi:aspartate kinase
MGKTTDDLVALAKQVSDDPPKREMDQLLVTGEQVTISLMAMALEAMGAPAISFTAGQIGLVTDEAHTKARIQHIAAERIHRELDAGKIVIVAGFQGVTEDGAVTTLGRGGSNVTLVAVAAALKADVCENYTDVDGIFTADPRIVPNARRIDTISYDEMLELASLGATVLHHRAVEFAKKYDVRLHVRNSEHNRKGTFIVHENESMERIMVRGAALKENLARVTLNNVPDHPGVVAKIFHRVALRNIVVDDIIQNSAKVSAVGVGMRTHTGVAEKMFAALAAEKINIQNITTSEIRISCLIDRRQGKKALRAVHDAFELGGPTARKATAGKTRNTAKRK